MEAEFDVSAEKLRTIETVPWSTVRRTARWLRKIYFTHPRPDAPALVVPHAPATIRSTLGAAHFEPGWELSYRYHGETLNLRRPYYEEVRIDGAIYRWHQLHARGFEHESGGTALLAHTEVDPIENPQRHVSLDSVDTHRGTNELGVALQKAGVSYYRRDGGQDVPGRVTE
jgi:hypothetical protein